MKPDAEKLRALARVLLKTRPEEMSCDDWLDRIAAYAEHVLANRATPASLCEVQRHMEMCPECAEEFRAILTAVRDED